MSDVKEIILDCERCGGRLVKVSASNYKCDHCGYTKVIETTTSAEVVAILNQANVLRNKGEFDDAFDVFTEAVRKDENNPEGYWGLFLSDYGIMHVLDPETKTYIPTCNRASSIPTSEDKNFKRALELSNELQKADYITKAVQLEEIRQKIVDISKNESPYDIFICYKRTQSNENGKESYTEDAIDARDIYDILSDKGYKVFFAEKTLQNLAGSEYEPIIYNALNTSKLMIVICSDLEYINSPWVKNEWRRYLKQIEFDNSKRLIPVMCNGFKAVSLPDALKKFQGLEMNVNFQASLINSVAKIVDNSKKNTISRVTVEERRSAKKLNVVKSNVEIRKVGDTGSTLIVSDEKLLKVAFSYVLKNMNKDAAREFRRLSSNSKLAKICDFALTYLQFRVKPNVEIIDKFNECISSSNDIVAGYIFECVVRDFEDRLSKRDLDRAIVLYSALMGWDNGSNEKVFGLADAFVREFPNNKSIKVAEVIAKYYNNQDVDGYISLMKDYASMYFNNNSTYEGGIILKKIIEVDEGDNDSRWGAFISSFGAIDDDSIKYCAQYINDKNISEFKDVLAYIPENERSVYISKFAKGIAEGVSLAKASTKVSNAKFVNYVANSLIKGSNFNIDKILKKEESSISKKFTLKKVILNLQKTSVNIHSPFQKDSKVLDDVKYWVYEKAFDNVIKFYSQDSTEDLIISLYKMADECRYARQFNLASKYYRLIINERNTEHRAYWGLLQCKLKCINNSELIASHHKLGNYDEYNNAIQIAGMVDDKAIDGYLNVKQAQNGQRAKNKMRLLKNKIGYSLVCGLLAVMALSLIVGVGWYTTPVVTFLNYDGTKICEVQVERGGKATPKDMSKFTRPDDYYATDYKFVGWTKSVDNVTHRMTVKAVFEGTPIYYNLTINCGQFGTLTYQVKGEERITLKGGESATLSLTYGQHIKFDVTPDEGFVCSDWKFEKNVEGSLEEIQRPINAKDDFLYAMGHEDIVISSKFELYGYTEISTAKEFYNIRNNRAGKYCLVKDIDLSEYSNWETICNFTGSFHGLGHTISNLKISSNSTNSNNCGLFGNVTNAKIRGFKLTNVNINIGSNLQAVAGAIASVRGDDALIRDIEVSGTINAPSAIYVAGVVGSIELNSATSDIYNLINNVMVIGYNSVGGVFGRVSFQREQSNLEIYDCSNSGNITGNEEVGGIFGCVEKENDGDRLNFSNLKNSGHIKGRSSFIGGIAGRTYRINMAYCSNNSKVEGWGKVGAIVGKAEYASMSHLDNEGSIVISNCPSLFNCDLGGMFGVLCGGDINNCTNNAVISSNGCGKIGGLVGSYTIERNTALRNLGNDQNVGIITSKYVGGLFGYVESEHVLTLTNCSVKGSVVGSSDVGALIGYTKSKQSWVIGGDWNANYVFENITIRKTNEGLKLVNGEYSKANEINISYVEI